MLRGRFVFIIRKANSPSAVILALSLAAKVLSFLAALLVANVLGPREFGVFNLIQSTLTMSSALALVGLLATSNRFFSRNLDDGEASAHLLGLILCCLALSTTTFSLAMLVGRSGLSAWMSPVHDLNGPLAALALFFPSFVAVQLATAVLNGLTLHRKAAAIGMVMPLVYSSLLPLALHGQATATNAFAALGLGASVAAVLAAFSLVRYFSSRGIRPKFPRIAEEGRLFIHYAIPSALSGNVVTLTTWWVNARLASSEDGLRQMGLLAAAQQWQTIIIFAPMALAPLILSRFSLTGVDPGGELRTQLTRIAGLTLLPTLFLASMSGPLMAAFGKGFNAIPELMPLMCVVALLSALMNVIGQFIASGEQMWSGFALNMLWAVAFLAASEVLTPHGAVGVACAYYLSYLLFLVAAAAYVRLKLVRQPAG